MCYLVAKDRNAHGCFALKTTHGKHLVELKRELNKEVGYKGVQLVTISRPTAFRRLVCAGIIPSVVRLSPRIMNKKISPTRLKLV